MLNRLALGSLTIVAVVALTAPVGFARGGAHPHFNDGGTLTWHHRLADASAAACREGKVIFVEYGRLRCPSCRVVVSRVLPDPRVRSRLSKIAVGLASDCDRPEPAVDRLLRQNLRNARMLPFCGFLTADGRWITGWGGHCSVDRFLVHLRKAEQVAARSARPAPPARKPELRPCPPPREAPTAGTPCTPPKPVVAPPQPQPVRPRVETLARRAPMPSRYPAPNLAGSPDAGTFDGPALPDPTGACAPPDVAAPSGPLPPPRIVIGPPVRVARATGNNPRARSTERTTPTSRSGTRSTATRRRAESAAKEGAWGDVLRLTAADTNDPVLGSLRRRAHAWAHATLDQAVDAIAQGRFEAGLGEVKAVLLEMPGQPEWIDAERGLEAIRTLLELQYLNPDGEVAKVVRQSAYDDLRGTRWASLFRS